MKRVNVNLSRYPAERTPGEALALCKRNQPRIGVAKGEFEVPDSFFEPLPEEILKAFRAEITSCTKAQSL